MPVPARPRPRAGSLVLLFLTCLVLALPASSSAAPRRRGKELPVAEQYELGLRYLKRGYYQKALETFSRIRNYHRDDPLAVKAELAVADVYYRKSEWDQARLAYEDFMRMHPRHPDLDYVVYRIGMSLYRKAPKVSARDQTWTRQAVNTWAGFEARFPESEHRVEVAERYDECRDRLADKELRIARFYERRKAWRAVEGRARGLVRTYPDAPATQPEGLELLALSGAWLGDTATVDEALGALTTHDPAAAERLRARIARIPPPEAR